MAHLIETEPGGEGEVSDMRRIESVGLCCAAVLAISAVAVAPASAAPDFGRCKALTGGKYQDKGCTKTSAPGKEKYEWYPWGSEQPTPENRSVSIKLKPKTSVTFETVSGVKVTCTGATGAGEIYQPNFIYFPGGMTFSGCTSAAKPCTSAGQAAGTITANIFYNQVGWIKQSTNQGGWLIGSGNNVWIEFECFGGPLANRLMRIYNYAVSNPVKFGKMSTLETVKFAATKGKQSPESMETYGGPWYLRAQVYGPAGEFIEEQQTGLTMTMIQKYNEKWEINPVV